MTYGDSRYSYLARTLPSGASDYKDTPQIVTQVINATPIGSWSALYSTYRWSSFANGDTLTQHTAQMPQGNSVWNPEGITFRPPIGTFMGGSSGHAEAGVIPGGWDDKSHSGSGKFEVSYTITDTDGAVGEAKYVLMLHDEWEHPTSDDTSFWTEAGTGTRHYGESIDGWFTKAISPVTVPQGDAKWTVSGNVDLGVELKAETSANFGLADWFKFSGSSTMDAKLNFNTSIQYTITPQDCGIVPKKSDGTIDTSVSYQPVISDLLPKESSLKSRELGL